jgi:hypothetical protein
MVIFYFISLAGCGMNPVFMVVATYTYRHRQAVRGKNVVQMAACHLPVRTLMRN